MNIYHRARNTLALLLVASLAACSASTDSVDTSAARTENKLTVQQVRNATIKLEVAGTTFLVDPMLAPKGAYPGFPGTYNSHLRNPLVDLPLPVEEVMAADAVIVTHRHDDHWDEVAKERLPKDMPIFVQNEADAKATRNEGFTDVRVLDRQTVFGGVTLTKTGGQHGDDAVMTKMGEILGEVMGVVFQHPETPSVYLAGDTVWNHEVVTAITQHQPDVIILNTGYARVQGFDGSIIMGKEDLARAHQTAPDATLIGSHMEAVNHAMQTREELRDYIAERGMDPKQVLVPQDGESVTF